MATLAHECGSCGHEARGYTKTELEKDGWQWHVIGKTAFGTADTYFIMCDGCTGAAEQRAQDRRDREQRARVPRGKCSHCNAETMVLPAPDVVVGTCLNRALPTSLCRDCDKYPALLRTVSYTSADWAMPDFFFPSSA